MRAWFAAPTDRQRILATTSFVHLLNDACFAVLYPLLPLIAADLALSYTQVGLIKTAFAGASSVLQLPVGVIAGWWGEGLVLLLGNAWVGLGLAAMGLTGGYVALLLVSVLAGLGGNAQHPLATALVSRTYVGKGSGTALGTLNFSGDLGKFLGPPVASLLVVGFGWRGALLAIGVVTAVSTFGLLAGQRALLPALPAPVAAHSVAPAPATGRSVGGGFSLVLLAGGLDNATRQAALTFLPFIFAARDVPLTGISLLFTLIFAAGAAGKFACGWLGDRFGPFVVIVVTELTTGLALLGLLAAPQWAAPPLCLLLGFALNGTSSVLLDLVARLVPAARHTHGYGAYFTASLVSGAAAPLVYGALGDRTGLTPVFVAMALLAAAVVPVTLPLRRLFAR